MLRRRSCRACGINMTQLLFVVSARRTFLGDVVDVLKWNLPHTYIPGASPGRRGNVHKRIMLGNVNVIDLTSIRRVSK